MIARRGVSGQLTAVSDGGTYALVFDRGHIVAAGSPSLADTAAAIALASDLITPAQIAVVERWLDAVPDAEELQVLATVALMTADEVHRLRRRVIAQRAARMIALEHGDFVLTSTIGLPVEPDCEMYAGGVIYKSARCYIYPTRLHAALSALGTRFELRADAHEDLVYYGFTEHEKPFLRALAGGVSLETIQNIANEADRRMAQATVYALASCGALHCEAAASASARLARGTRSPLRGKDTTPPMDPQLSTEPLTKSNAEEAFQRAQIALRGERIDDAIFDLELATELAPNEPQYFAALAWARFCRSTDKQGIANETRRMLGRAIASSESPVLPRYYLGMVERIMNRTEHALEHFREVLELQPNHREAATEIRFLTRKR